MKKIIRITVSFLLLFVFVINLTACIGDIFGGGGKANCYASSPSLKWNYVNDYYYMEAQITNSGDADAKNVWVYYYYTDFYSMNKYTDSVYMGTIGKGETVTFISNKN